MLVMKVLVFEFPSETRCEEQKIVAEDQDAPSTNNNVYLKLELQ